MSNAGGKFVPVPGPETRSWWESCRAGRLLVQHCRGCGHHQFYPRPTCVSCGSGDVEWVETAGSGTVTTYTICHVPVSEAYAADVPYVVALVRLQEGPTLMSNIVECDPESVFGGMPVEVVFETRSEAISLPQFRPRSELRPSDEQG